MERLKRCGRHLRMGCGESLCGYDQRDLSMRRRPVTAQKSNPPQPRRDSGGVQDRPK